MDELMLGLLFAGGFAFALLALWDLRSAVRDSEMPVLGLLGSVFSAVVWFVLSSIWPAAATAEMYVSVAWLWIGLGWTFVVVAFSCVFLILKSSVKPGRGGLEIREEEPRL